MVDILETEQEKQALHEFLAKMQHEVPEREAVKFLMARKFDVARTIDLYRAHVGLRQRENLADISPHDKNQQRELDTKKFIILPRVHPTQPTIALFTARLHFPKETAHQNTLAAVIHLLDQALEMHEAQRHGLLVIYDMSGSRMSNFDLDLSKKVLSMLKGSYPARLKRVLIVTAPLWFKAPYRLLRLFVREKLRDRVHTVSPKELQQYVPKDHLPAHLGGTLLLEEAPYFEHPPRSESSSRQTSHSDSIISDDGKGTPESVGSPVNVFDDSPIHDVDMGDAPPALPQKKKNGSCAPSHSMNSIGSVETRPCSDGNSPPIDGNGSENHVTSSSGSVASTSSLQNDVTEGSPIMDVDESPFYDSIHILEPIGLSIDQFVQHVEAKRERGVVEEYELIRSASPVGTFNFSRLNQKKNRYSDVPCMDQTRIVLKSDTGADYINANFVDGYKHKDAYINTQGPLKHTVADFWQMIWDQQVLVIVMTTKTVERGRVKCEQYWPLEEGEAASCGAFQVRTLQVESYRDFAVTTLELVNLQRDETRLVKHCQYLTWPDHGVPKTLSFLQFLFLVRNLQTEQLAQIDWHGHPSGPAMAIHCSAGIGRTGTFCTIDICLQRLNDVGTIDVETTVRRLRSQRALSIQTPDQYVFCHLAIIEYATSQGLIEKRQLDFYDEDDD